MLPADVDAILQAASAAGTAFAYQKDCYALSVLCHVIGGGRRISELRRGPYARLLEKPIVKKALAGAAHGVLTPACVRAALPSELETFSVTLDRWGGRRSAEWSDSYYQTSRPGQNLVVQLNFPTAHDRAYRALVGRDVYQPFVCGAHPARATEPFTLAWARLDVDRAAGEVLIEEVQCDWVKRARSFAVRAEGWLRAGEPSYLPFDDDLSASAPELLRYVESVLRPYAALWEECVLTAALELSYAELGARTVYFHSFESGRIGACSRRT